MKFRFYKNNTDPTPSFECILVSKQCKEKTINQTRCKKKSVIGVPYCYIHLLNKKHLRVKKSTIPNSGNGLFAINKNIPNDTIVFKKGDYIIDYFGEKVTNDILNNRYGEKTAPYGIVVNKTRDIYEDGACQRGIGSLINHKSSTFANAKFYVNRSNNTIKIKAIKNIKNGHEIFINYGRRYKFNENTKNTTSF